MTWRKWITVALVILVAIFVAAAYLRFGGVTHRQIIDAVETESSALKETVHSESEETRRCIEERCDELDRKLERIELKLDRLLKIAERPLPDGLQEVR